MCFLRLNHQDDDLECICFYFTADGRRAQVLEVAWRRKGYEKDAILDAVRQYAEETMRRKAFQPGDRINYAGRVYDADELTCLVDASLDFWLTAGKYTKEFETEFGKFLGVPYVSLTTSGSSANLLAVMALTSPLLGERRLQKGDEVITVAAGFPTTVAPIVQAGAVPVFIDIDIPSYNADMMQFICMKSSQTSQTSSYCQKPRRILIRAGLASLCR